MGTQPSLPQRQQIESCGGALTVGGDFLPLLTVAASSCRRSSPAWHFPAPRTGAGGKKTPLWGPGQTSPKTPDRKVWKRGALTAGDSVPPLPLPLAAANHHQLLGGSGWEWECCSSSIMESVWELSLPAHLGQCRQSRSLSSPYQITHVYLVENLSYFQCN